MRKKLFLILTITGLLVFSTNAAVFAAENTSSSVNVDEMAVYLNNDFSANGSSSVDGSIYTAKGNVDFDGNSTSTGTIYHKAGTQFNYPSWYKNAYPFFVSQGAILNETVYNQSCPDLASFPVINKTVPSYVASDFSSPVISEDTHFKSLKVNREVTIDVSNKDITLVVDQLTFSEWSGSLKLNGNGSLYLYINTYSGGDPIVIKNGNNPDKTYIVSKSNISDDNLDLYAHVIMLGIHDLNFNGTITGSVVTDAEHLSIANNEVINGLVYAPNATAAVKNSGLIKGRLVADKLSLDGNGKINYDPTYASYSKAVPAQTPEYQLNVSVNDPSMGVVSPTSQKVKYGQVVTVTATPNAGYVFTGFTSSNSSMIPDSSGKLTITGSVNLVAHFEPAGEYVKGILGEYYDSSELNNETALRMKRIDSSIAFNFMYDSPDPSIDPETFAIRWTGYIKPTVSGDYTFKTYSDDGIKVTVNNTNVIDKWGALSLDFTIANSPIHLEAGKYYPITVEYQQLPLYAGVFLFWESDKVPMSLVPDTAFYVKEPVYNEIAGTKYFNTLDKSGKGFTNTFYESNESGAKLPDPKSSEINNIDYWWAAGAPSGITTDSFYGEMEGYLEARCTESTTLQFLVDDGIRVWVDGKLVIDKWSGHDVESFEYTFDTEVGKKYHIKIEYIDMGLGATCVMRWKSPSIGEESIPAKYMFVN